MADPSREAAREPYLLVKDEHASQLVFAYEAVLSEMRTYASRGGITAEWVRRLDFARVEFCRAALSAAPGEATVPEALVAAREKAQATALKAYLAAIKLGKIGNDAILAACRAYAAVVLEGAVIELEGHREYPLGEDGQLAAKWRALIVQLREGGIPAPRGEEVDRMNDLLAALRVFGVEPPEHPGEEWTVISEPFGPEPVGGTAKEAAEWALDLLSKPETEEVERIVRDAIEECIFVLSRFTWGHYDPIGALRSATDDTLARVRARLGRKGEG